MIGRKKRAREIEKPISSMMMDTFFKTLQADDNSICAFCKQGKTEVSSTYRENNAGNILYVMKGIALFKKFPSLQEMCDLEDAESAESRVESGIDSTGTWACVYPIGMSKSRLDKMAWSHFVCAAFSPRAWLSSSVWYNLKSEILRSSYFECCLCKQRGASVGCVLGKCNYVVHVYCAIEQLGWRPSMLRREFMCPEHCCKVAEQLRVEDGEYDEDISQGHEAMPVTMDRPHVDVIESNSSLSDPSGKSTDVLLCGECTSAPPDGGEEPNGDGSSARMARFIKSPRDFTYLRKNIDSDATQSVVQNTNKLPCCDCEGMCVDPDLCVCLQVLLAGLSILHH